MMRRTILSEIEGLGSVRRCPGCPDLHITIGAVDIRVSEAAFKELAKLISQSVEALYSEKEGNAPSSAPSPSWESSQLNSN